MNNIDIEIKKALNNTRIDVIINNLVELDKKYEDYLSLISDESEKMEKRVSFYRKLYDIKQKTRNKELTQSITDIIIKHLDMDKVISFNQYMIIMDTYIFSAIECYGFKEYDKSKKYLRKITEFGKREEEYSKQNFYDALNCAYTWIGYYEYNEGEYKKAYKHYDTVLKNYEKVKDDPLYYVKEKESVPNSIKFIEKIKSKIDI